MDVYGHHASVCAVKGDRIKRHNLIQDIIYDFCYAAAWAPSKEKPYLLPNTSERPADVFVPNYSFGKDLVLDVAITCPLQHKYLHDASVTTGFVMNMLCILNRKTTHIGWNEKALFLLEPDSTNQNLP